MKTAHLASIAALLGRAVHVPVCPETKNVAPSGAVSAVKAMSLSKGTARLTAHASVFRGKSAPVQTAFCVVMRAARDDVGVYNAKA